MLTNKHREQETMDLLYAILDIWHIKPEMRLMKMLLKASGSKDLFYITDKELKEGLRKMEEDVK